MGCGAAELTVCVVPWSEAGLEAREDLDSMRRTHTHAEADADAREVWVQGSRLRAQGCAQGASGHVLRRLAKHAPLAPSASGFREPYGRWRVGAICQSVGALAPSASGFQEPHGLSISHLHLASVYCYPCGARGRRWSSMTRRHWRRGLRRW